MKILELEINNIRGIKNLLLKPNGHNFLIWGPNGSGKSAVVDAIDFLLTGRITRLTGPGTRGITLSRHGPHIDHEPEDASVRAIFQLSGFDTLFEIKRCIDNPNNIECDPVIKKQIEPILELSKRGQHILTRRDILRFVTSEAGTRAREIQELLNITDIENIRKTFVSVRNTLEKEIESEKRIVEQAKSAVNITANLKEYDEKAVLGFINKNRAILDGKAILDIDYEKIKIGLKPPMIIITKLEINPDLLLKDVENIKELLSEENKKIIMEKDKQLRILLNKIRIEPDVLISISKFDLIKLGLDLLHDDICPLCDVEWPEGELKKYLENKLKDIEVAVSYKNQIIDLSRYITNYIDRLSLSLESLIYASKKVKLEKDKKVLQSLLSSLKIFSDATSLALEKYPLPEYDENKIQDLITLSKYDNNLYRIINKVKETTPEITPEQIAWDTLSYLEENLKFLKNAQINYDKKELPYNRSEILLDVFLQSRDKILSELYDRIRDRFVNLYRELHKIDEGEFSATIEPDRAGLDFKVDFYGRGTNPPHALHSEGHQDSMGICLFLALSDELTKGLIDLIILDDVVMSVDADHRRQVCQILGTLYPKRQFFITTHDKTWANQLKKLGIVSSKESVEFFNWNISSGPQTSQQSDIWNRIDKDLKGAYVSDAAAKLRRGSEDFFEMVCDALHGKITYKADLRWELGDYLPAAMKEYNELLKQAKRAANSWGQQDQMEMLNELDSVKKQIFSRVNVEQWAIDVNVHYNNWTNFTLNDFQPVVEAFQDLWSLFICSNCGSILYVTKKGDKKTSVQCNCGNYHWNLIEKA